MNIENIASFTSVPIGGPAPLQQVTREPELRDLVDAFNPGVDPQPMMQNLSASDINSLVFAEKSIGKGNFQFKIKAQEQAPDGTTFVAYCDPNKKDGNYISAVNSDGSIKWDKKVGENGLEDLKTGPDGAVYARTGDELVAFDGDGKEKFRTKFECEVKDHWVDGDGNNYFRQCKGNGFYIIDKDGKKVDLPPVLRDLTPSEVKIADDGSFWCRQNNTITRVDLKAGTSSQVIYNDPTSGDHVPQEFFPAPDGGVYLRTQYNQYVPDTHYGDLHRGLNIGGFRFGMPHLPMDDYPQGTTISSNYIYKLDTEGKIQWSSGDIGSHPEVDVSSGGTVYSADDRQNKDSKYELNQLAPSSEQSVLATFDKSIETIRVRPGDDHVFVHSGSTLTELNPDGSPAHTTSLGTGMDEKEMLGFNHDSNVVLADGDRSRVYVWNPATDTTTCMTDHEKDYSYKTVLKQIEEGTSGTSTTTEPGPEPVIEQTTDGVNVDGVSLSKKKKKF